MSAPQILNGDTGLQVRGALNVALDIQNGMFSLGPELISNTDFAVNADGWTLGSDSLWSAGRITTTLSEAEEPAISTPVLGLQAGHMYLVAVDFTVADDTNAVFFDTAPGYWKSDGPNLAFLATVGVSGNENLTLDFDEYNPGSTRVITRVSMREITISSRGLVFYDPDQNAKFIAINTDGQGSIAIGNNTLPLISTGANNIALGNTSLAANTSGYDNIAIGGALPSNTEGHDNFGIGQATLGNNTTGDFNIAIGNNSGGSIVAGSSNIIIGSYADAPSDTSNYLNLGSVIKGQMDTGPLEVTKPIIIIPPTSDPLIAGALWNNAGTPAISAGP